jgi:endonuclease G, mitochondrial
MNTNPSGDFIAMAGQLAHSEYDLSLSDLIDALDSDLGRLRYGRLLGVLVKMPFADCFPITDPHSSKTNARYAWTWDENRLHDFSTHSIWQYALLKYLSENLYNIADAEPADVYRFVHYEGCVEGRILKYVLNAAHNNICGNEDARRKIKAAVDEARKKGAKVADPSLTNFIATIGGVTTTVVASCGGYGVALGPIAGGLAILISRIGLDAFCTWSHDKLEELRETEKGPEMAKLMTMSGINKSKSEGAVQGSHNGNDLRKLPDDLQ